jgi:hypothetical protein
MKQFRDPAELACTEVKNPLTGIFNCYSKNSLEVVRKSFTNRLEEIGKNMKKLRAKLLRNIGDDATILGNELNRASLGVEPGSIFRRKFISIITRIG